MGAAHSEQQPPPFPTLNSPLFPSFSSFRYLEAEVGLGIREKASKVFMENKKTYCNMAKNL